MEVYLMRTNIFLDDKLVKEAFKYSDVKTKKDLVHLALQEFIQNRRKKNLLELKGKVQFADDYDYKKMRETRR